MIDFANSLLPEGVKPGPPLSESRPFPRKSFADIATTDFVNSDHVLCDKETVTVKNPVKSRPTWLHCDVCQVRFAPLRGLDTNECTGQRPTFSGMYTASSRKRPPPEKHAPHRKYILEKDGWKTVAPKKLEHPPEKFTAAKGPPSQEDRKRFRWLVGWGLMAQEPFLAKLRQTYGR
ncbi:hypothetical protein AVEN_175460-1 [Araneus ventricosus]|uniref:Uncharacterized protein n=1 Tax=Araneus ventricosus TaxID=182803 RepID=A0A4Y2RD01_ARAVE|nr:hypothetical protein AVEN_175460-1 [Araneus ventricosus]